MYCDTTQARVVVEERKWKLPGAGRRVEFLEVFSTAMMSANTASVRLIFFFDFFFKVLEILLRFVAVNLLQTLLTSDLCVVCVHVCVYACMCVCVQVVRTASLTHWACCLDLAPDNPLIAIGIKGEWKAFTRYQRTPPLVNCWLLPSEESDSVLHLLQVPTNSWTFCKVTFLFSVCTDLYRTRVTALSLCCASLGERKSLYFVQEVFCFVFVWIHVPVVFGCDLVPLTASLVQQQPPWIEWPHHQIFTELRSCVKVEVSVLGSPSLIVLVVSVDIKQH